MVLIELFLLPFSQEDVQRPCGVCHLCRCFNHDCQHCVEIYMYYGVFATCIHRNVPFTCSKIVPSIHTFLDIILAKIVFFFPRFLRNMFTMMTTPL